MFLDKEAIYRATVLRPDDFKDAHRHIYQTVLTCHKGEPAIGTVTEAPGRASA